jgi:hypothetical protein
MGAWIDALRRGLVVLAVVGTAEAQAAAQEHGAAIEEQATAVRRMLERLPYYGVFDYLVFRVDGGTVFLAGHSFDGRLGGDAEAAVRRVAGVVEVKNAIEDLSRSPSDDRIRWATFYRIYTDDFLSRYAPGGVVGVLHELRYERRFPGMQPAGRYPIHIVVKNGRTMLLGIVDGAVDRRLAEIRAREVAGVFEVENDLAEAPRESSNRPEP